MWMHGWAVAGQELPFAMGATWSAWDVKGVSNLVQCGIIIAILVIFFVLVILCEIIEASVTHQSQLVMHDSQVIDNSILILPALATPGAECYTVMMEKGIRGMDILEAHYFRQLDGWYKPKEMDAFMQVSCHLDGSFQIFPSTPGVLNLKDRGV